MRTLLIPFLLASFVRTVHAGVCISPEENDEAMAAIEAHAKDKKTIPEERSYSWLCAEIDALRLKARIGKACRTILERDGLDREGNPSQCVRIASAAGFAKLGKYDLYELAAKQHEDPLKFETVQGLTQATLLGRMGDPRGLPIILETWKAAIPRVEPLQKRRDSMRAWSAWRQRAAAAIGVLGGRDEIAFLEEQAKATTDTFVVKACRSAIAAIEKRLGPAAPAAPAAPAPKTP